MAAQPSPEPTPSRPYMPGYGVVGPSQGSGLLPWSWAEERLASSHDYWLTTTWPDGRPHVMPVWGCGTSPASGSAAAGGPARP